MQKIFDSELDYPGNDGRYHHEGRPFTGIVVDGEDGGFVESEQEFRDGVPWGVGRSWHRNGQLASENFWVGGMQHGFNREWSEGGKLVLEEINEFGICISRKVWNKGGDLVGEYHLKESDPAFKQLTTLRARFPEKGGSGGTR